MTRKTGLFSTKAEVSGVKKNPRKAAKVEEVEVEEVVQKVKKPIKSKVAPKETAKPKAATKKPTAKKAAPKKTKVVEDSPESQLMVVIPRFFENKTIGDKHKKLADADNKIIKTLMERGELEEFEVNDIVASLSTRESTSYVEDLLLAKIKELEVPGIIKTVEVVDREALESAIAHGEIALEDLVDTQKTTSSTALYVKPKK